MILNDTMIYNDIYIYSTDGIYQQYIVNSILLIFTNTHIPDINIY
jgi:hypothetical protein